MGAFLAEIGLLKSIGYPYPFNDLPSLEENG